MAKTPPPPSGIAGRIAELKGEIAKLDEITEEARSVKSYTPAVQAISRAATLRSELRRLHTASMVEGEPDELRRVDYMLRQAVEDGSWAAAQSISRDLHDRRKQLEAEAKAAEEAARLAADPREVMRTLTEALRGLPPDMAHEIRESIGWT